MAKKAFNNFGSTRAAVTPATTLNSTLALSYTSGVANPVSAMTLLSNIQTSSALYLRRNDKNFTHRLKEYVTTNLYPDNLEVATISRYDSNQNTSWWSRYKKTDITLNATKFALLGTTTGTITPTSAAWRQYAGKLQLGFRSLLMLQYFGYEELVLPYQYRADLPMKAPATDNPDADTNWMTTNSPRGGYETITAFTTPEYTPFNFNAAAKNYYGSAATANLEHPFNDFVSGCTVGSKKNVTALIEDFKDMYMGEVLSYINNLQLYRDAKKLFDTIKAASLAGDTQPYLSMGNLGFESVNSIYTLLVGTYVFPSIGSAFTGSSTGLVHFESNAASAYNNYETIERQMSNYTFALTGSIAGVQGGVAFTKTGRNGALRSQLLVMPDNISRKKYELGLVEDVPAAPYAGLLSTRPLGLFTTLTAADGWACEVRLKDTQLSLVAMGMSQFVSGANCLGVMLGPVSGTSQAVYSGVNIYSNTVKLAYTKLNSVTTTLDGASCKVFGWGTAISATTSGYSTTTTNQNLTALGGVDPTLGTRHAPDNNTIRPVLDAHPVKLICCIPYNVDDMKVDGSGNVAYFSLADGCANVFGQWSCKYAFGYLKGSYQVFTRLTTFGQLKTIHGASKTIEECIDLATTAFITECLGYITVADADPQPFEQLMAYTPLQYVGYDLPPMKSYVRRFYDYKVYPVDVLAPAPNKALIKKANSLGGILSGGLGTRINDIVKPYYGTKRDSRPTSFPSILDAADQWKASLLLDIGVTKMDAQNGIYDQGNAAAIKAKWGGGALLRLKPSGGSVADFKKAGRVGYRVASMNTGILNLSATMTKHANFVSVTSNLNNSIPIYRDNYSATTTNRSYGVQADSSPELLNIAMLQSDQVGKPRDSVALTFSMWAFPNSTSYMYYVPSKLSAFDYMTNATRVLSGVASRNDVPTDGLLVRLQDRLSGEVLAVQLSQKGGKYRFYGCQPHREYLVSTIDPLREYTADIEDVKEL
ncbi:MAG: hypothetical protein RR280_01385 [Bacteroidaceae bacterium]